MALKENSRLFRVEEEHFMRKIPEMQLWSNILHIATQKSVHWMSQAYNSKFSVYINIVYY